MRPSQNNRRFYWLPLLCMIWTAPASAQWTTVWTPDSAPAEKNISQDDKHDSDPTKCYPCKEWEEYPDGGGRWNKLDDVQPIECPEPATRSRRDNRSQDSLPDHLNPCKTCKAGEVDNMPDGTPVDAGEGCGCCKDGQPWAPDPDCPDPMEIDFNFVYAGPCRCISGELGCVFPVPPPVSLISFSSCYDNCEWKPVPPESFTIGYLEGLCPERCDGVVYSVDDVNADNYCAVLDKLNERIRKGEEWVINPPTGSTPDPSIPPESYCFVDCMLRHEAIHVEQLRCMWDDLKHDILGTLSGISLPFECETAETPEQATELLKTLLMNEMQLIYNEFWADWLDPETIADQEREAHQDTLDCLNDLLEHIQNKAEELNWPVCNPPKEETP